MVLSRSVNRRKAVPKLRFRSKRPIPWSAILAGRFPKSQRPGVTAEILIFSHSKMAARFVRIGRMAEHLAVPDTGLLPGVRGQKDSFGVSRPEN